MIVIGCGKAKRAEPAAARDLYVGSLFRAARHYAELSGQRWVILSAAHGIVDPQVVLRPYDQTLAFRSRWQRQRWALHTADSVFERLAHGIEVVEILAGKTYADPLAKALESLEVEVSKPLEGLGLGQRIQKLYALGDRELARRGHGYAAE